MAETQTMRRRQGALKKRIDRARREAIGQREPRAAYMAYQSVMDTYARRVAALVERHVLERLPVLGSGDPLDVAALEAGLAELQPRLDVLADRMYRSAYAAGRRASQHAHREVSRMLNMEVPASGAEMDVILQNFARENVAAVKRMGARQVAQIRKAIAEYEDGESMRDRINHALWVSRNHGQVIARSNVYHLAEREIERWALAVGSEGGIVHTRRDENVRESHQPLEGKFFPRRPPQLDDPNCRCRWIPVEALQQ